MKKGWTSRGMSFSKIHASVFVGRERELGNSGNCISSEETFSLLVALA
jgi:hypothetical protein